MNRRPTPETDKAKCKFTSLLGDDEDAYWVPLKVARRLEIERDEARADLEFRRGLFQLQEKQLNEVRAERDEWKQKFIQQNKDLGCEMMDPGGTIWDYAKKLQDENKALQEQLNFERDVNKHKAVADAISIGEAAGKSAQDQIEALQEQLDSAIMLGKMQERRHEREIEKLTVNGIHTCHDQCQRPICALSRELNQERDKANHLIAAAKAVIDRWETPFWKEAEHTGAYIAALRKAVEIAEGGYL